MLRRNLQGGSDEKANDDGARAYLLSVSGIRSVRLPIRIGVSGSRSERPCNRPHVASRPLATTNDIAVAIATPVFVKYGVRGSVCALKITNKIDYDRWLFEMYSNQEGKTLNHKSLASGQRYRCSAWLCAVSTWWANL